MNINLNDINKSDDLASTLGRPRSYFSRAMMDDLKKVNYDELEMRFLCGAAGLDYDLESKLADAAIARIRAQFPDQPKPPSTEEFIKALEEERKNPAAILAEIDSLPPEMQHSVARVLRSGAGRLKNGKLVVDLEAQFTATSLQGLVDEGLAVPEPDVDLEVTGARKPKVRRTPGPVRAAGSKLARKAAKAEAKFIKARTR